MRRTWLEMQVDIIKVLARNGPLKLSHIVYQVNINCHVLKQCLDFLIQRNLVEIRTLSKKRVVYAITQRGRPVLKYNWEVTSLQTTGEAHKITPLLYWARWSKHYSTIPFFLSFKSKMAVTIIPKVKNSQDAKLRMNGIFVQGLTSDVNVW